MKTIKERKKRVYTSMFDPFRQDIESWCDQGMTLKEAFEMLPEGYTYAGFIAYLRSHKIRNGSWQRSVDARNICDKCDYCKHFKNSMGKYNLHENRICTRHWRVLTSSVRHCPRWCDLEKGTAK